ncbi:FAD/NAD(P)-binding domain containing protein [Trema orientale]|uniref:FAD/NAD(P)-binding domain containing protein n=1 Tax=Trema orientale TaxID=63057 RepID=A0A2P5ED87_TREOI|nr:FAD/NAD(P)-binding domain containing protein [Trema orientale]
MHPMAPDLGQNECAAFEDAVVLAQHIGDPGLRCNRGFMAGEGLSRALGRYADQRRRRTAGLMALSSTVRGLVEQGGSRLLMEFFRKLGFDRVFYKWVFGVMHYDYGKLPCVYPNSELETENEDQ